MLWVAKVKASQDETPSKFRVSEYSKSIVSKRPPEYLRLRVDISREEAGGRPVHILSPRGGASRGRILYLHGGSYIANATRIHWRFLADLVERTNCAVVAPDYPLAPEYCYADAYRMLVPLYRKMTFSAAELPKPLPTLIMGDSAGGGLALGLAMMIRDEKLSTPTAVVMLSPWLDVTLDNPYIGEIDPEDHFLNISALKKAGKSWARGANPLKPLISPIYGDFRDLPPMHLFTGTKDILIADCRRFRGLCMAARANLSYYEYENMLHVWMLLEFKEAIIAAKEIAAIVDTAIN
jgi:epsilon-lactone hydrolase